MTDFVEITDDNSSDNEVQNIPAPTKKQSPDPAFQELKTLKSEMDFRGSLLNKTWSELSSIMSKYQAQLAQKHEELDASLSVDDHFRITQSEQENKMYKLEIQKLQKQLGDVESKLLVKDTEIVKLRTEAHKYRNEVQMKENLIEKIQAQMAQEAGEYQSEINALRDMLEQGQCDTGANMSIQQQQPTPTSAMSPAIKRRKTMTRPPIGRPPISVHQSPRPCPVHRAPSSSVKLEASGSSATASPVKTESFQSSCAMSDPATSQSGEQMDPVYDNADESFDQSQDGSQEHQFFKVDEVYDESNSGVEGLMLEGEDAQMMLQNMPQGQEQIGLGQSVSALQAKYSHWTEEQKRLIGMYAAEHGVMAAVNFFSRRYGVRVPQPTVSRFKKKYGTLPFP